MGKLVSVKTFADQRNKKLGTSYNWNSDQLINLEWFCARVRQVYNDIHIGIKTSTHRQFLSAKFSINNSKLIVDEDLLISVINYLSGFNRQCNCDCACTSNNPYNRCCNDCATGNCDCCTADCINKCACDCNCMKQNNCACHCECDCDCTPYDCNCTKVGSQCTFCTTGDCYKDCCQNCDCPCTCACEWW
jgi:hypothetical protein